MYYVYDQSTVENVVVEIQYVAQSDKSNVLIEVENTDIP